MTVSSGEIQELKKEITYLRNKVEEQAQEIVRLHVKLEILCRSDQKKTELLEEIKKQVDQITVKPEECNRRIASLENNQRWVATGLIGLFAMLFFEIIRRII